MSFDFTVSPVVFKALQTLDIALLSQCSAKDLRPILPCLVRLSLISPLDTTSKCSEGRLEILTLLSGIELVNSIVALLSIDFHALEQDVKREQQLRQKLGSAQSDSILVQSLQNGLALEFERSDSTRRLRLVLSEVLYISSQQQQCTTGDSYVKQSDLFDYAVYVPEISDVISIALAELPALLTVQDMVETLLHVNHGPEIICWVVANLPDSFNEVCTSLITNAERQDEENGGGRIRMHALSLLCQMNPSQALAVRAKCVEMCRMPALTITLSLDHAGRGQGFEEKNSDIVAFVSGLLLGNDQQVRNWFAMFVRNRQKRNRESNVTLQALRDELLHQLQTIIMFSVGNRLPDSYVVRASSLLRLYCALRGIAGIKFQEEEVSLIVQLVTSHPPPSPSGVRFVSLGLCMLIACPSLIALKEHETKCIEWVQWLVHEEAYFESASSVTASFGEMLLLMAIHFHSNQLSAICDLVCSTLGMKVPIRHNNMTRMKQIFTQEIFTEQVVTYHAVKVPVTANLNANIPGFLPVHCIHQLLKSRAFTKYKVPIKDWIYRQFCSSISPLHPVLPALVEVYVNSILVPNSKSPNENTNQPIEEEDIRKVFRDFISQGSVAENKSPETDIPVSLTPQLLMLYYVLHYEDVRLSTQAGSETVKVYSTEFLSELPIKYLLRQAQCHQQSYAGLFSPLLRLLATHFPHLSLVDDWFVDEDEGDITFRSVMKMDTSPLTESSVFEGLRVMAACPSQTEAVLRKMLDTPPTLLWPYADTIIQHIVHVIDSRVPRHIQELYKRVWLRLNSVLPRCLRAKTLMYMTNGEVPVPHPMPEHVVSDPLIALRCDSRIFRCPPILDVLLRVLQASLAASRSQLSRHKAHHHQAERGLSDSEMEDLRTAVVATQESIAAQILLEACCEMPEDRTTPGQLWALREVRSIICSYLHQVFIADPSLAKLVHFQGYSRELLPVTVPGIPSMHICLDFIPELLSQANIAKQVFAVDLVSHLSLQYALPKSMSIARLAINTLSTLITVLSAEFRTELFIPCLPALVRICEAFPLLVDDVVALLVHLGRVCLSFACAEGNRAAKLTCFSKISYDPQGDLTTQNDFLVGEIQRTFENILKCAVLKTKMYYRECSTTKI